MSESGGGMKSLDVDGSSAKLRDSKKKATKDGKPRKSFKEAYTPAAASLRKSISDAVTGRSDSLDSPDDPLLRQGGGGMMTKWEAIFNMANACIGAGLVQLGSTAAKSGAVAYAGGLLFAGWTAYLGADMLVRSAGLANTRSLETIGRKAFGECGIMITRALTIVVALVATTVYLALVTHSIGSVEALTGFNVNEKLMQIGISLFLVFPLCLIRDQKKLAISSAVCIAVFTAICVTCLQESVSSDWYVQKAMTDPANAWPTDKIQAAIQAAKDAGKSAAEINEARAVTKAMAEAQSWKLACPATEASMLSWKSDFVADVAAQLPLWLLAFVMHFTVIPVFAELEGGKVETMQSVNKFAVGIPVLLYTLVGLASFFAYNTNTRTSSLQNMRRCLCAEWEGVPCASRCKGENLCADEYTWGSILNVAFALALAVGFPNVQYILRKVQTEIMWGADTEFSWPVHIGLAAMNVIVPTVIAIAAKEHLGLIFNIGGTATGPTLAYLMPAGFYMAIMRKQKTGSTLEWVKAIFLFLLGFAVLVFGTYGVVMQIAELWKKKEE